MKSTAEHEGGEKKTVGVEGVVGVWTYREANANGGTRDELALVKLDQQRGLAHAAVSHQDRLQIESHKDTQETSCSAASHCFNRLRPLHCVGTRSGLLYEFICCSVYSPALSDAL